MAVNHLKMYSPKLYVKLQFLPHGEHNLWPLDRPPSWYCLGKDINTLVAKYGVFNVATYGTYSYHWALKGWSVVQIIRQNLLGVIRAIIPNPFSYTGYFFYRFPEHDSCHGVSRRVQAVCAIKLLCSWKQQKGHSLCVVSCALEVLISWFECYSFKVLATLGYPEIRTYGLHHAVHWWTSSPGVSSMFGNGPQPLLWACSRATRVSGVSDCVNGAICIVYMYNLQMSPLAA
jgi:hypothetical protein